MIQLLWGWSGVILLQWGQFISRSKVGPAATVTSQVLSRGIQTNALHGPKLIEFCEGTYAAMTPANSLAHPARSGTPAAHMMTSPT